MILQFEDHSLLQHNTFGLAVKAARFIEYDTAGDLCELIAGKKVISPWLHIGQGSNLLFIHDYPGTILHSRIKSIEVIEETSGSILVKVGSGMVWDDFVAYCVSNKWYGAENLSNIPGEVGASAVQNIGAYGVEVKDIIDSVFTVDLKGEVKTYFRDDCKFEYRYSIFKEPQMNGVFVTHVCFRLSKIPSYSLNYGMLCQEAQKYPEVSLESVRQAVIDIRASKLPDPAVLGNAGSFFMNPVVGEEKLVELQVAYPKIPFYDMGQGRIKIPAGWLIEKCGWKGKSIGPARVHDKQALVLVNAGGATGEDIVRLSDAVKKSVKEKFAIEIKPEVKFIS